MAEGESFSKSVTGSWLAFKLSCAAVLECLHTQHFQETVPSLTTGPLLEMWMSSSRGERSYVDWARE